MTTIKGMKHFYFGLVLLFLPVLLVSCGKKGPLKYEPKPLPQPVEQLELAQVGKDIRLEWMFPQLLSDKKTAPLIDEVGKILVYYSTKEIPGGKFKRKSTLLKKRSMEDLAKKGPIYSLTIPFKLKELDKKKHFFAVAYYYGKKKSPLSQVKSISTIIPITPVKDLAITREQKILRLKWSKPELDESGKKIVSIAGYNIYRQLTPLETAGEQATKSTGAANKFFKINDDRLLVNYYEDKDTGADGNYSYYVTTLSSKSSESDSSNIATLKVTDIFPPDPPMNLVVFKHKNHMLLTWEKVADKDLSHYIVYRSKSEAEEDSNLVPIAKKVTDNYFKDTKVSSDITYHYCVTAVDSKGNESKRSNIVKERF